jgi:hypothetical protein
VVVPLPPLWFRVVQELYGVPSSSSFLTRAIRSSSSSRRSRRGRHTYRPDGHREQFVNSAIKQDLWSRTFSTR